MSFALISWRSCGKWFCTGFVDETKKILHKNGRISGKPICISKRLVQKFKECEPWEKHFYKSTLVGISSAVNDNDFTSARLLCDIGSTEEATNYCLNLMLLSINFIANGEEVDVLVDCLPNLLYNNKL